MSRNENKLDPVAIEESHEGIDYVLTAQLSDSKQLRAEGLVFSYWHCRDCEANRRSPATGSCDARRTVEKAIERARAAFMTHFGIVHSGARQSEQ